MLMSQIFDYIRNDLSNTNTNPNPNSNVLDMEYIFMTPDTNYSRLIPINRRVIQDSSSSNVSVTNDDDYDNDV